MKVNKLEPFRLEEYFAKWEFHARYLFCTSDLESRRISDVLDLLPESDRKEFLDLPLSYTTTDGDENLRQEISKSYETIAPDQVLCTAGAEEAIYLAGKSLLESTDHVISISPGYQSLQSVAASICETSEVDLDLKDGQWSLDVSKIASAIRENTRALFINFPHNPTGFMPEKSQFLDMLELARKNGLIVFSDEVYREMELDPTSRLPAASDVYENAISLGVMSKSYGFAGLRIGWVASQNKSLLRKLGDYKHYLSICNSAPSEWLATAILRHKKRILNENRQMLMENYRLLRDYFKSRSDLFQWIDPKGGCTAYPRYLGREKIIDLADIMVRENGVLILPSSVYGQNNQHFRVAFGRKNCKESLSKFSEFFASRS